MKYWQKRIAILSFVLAVAFGGAAFTHGDKLFEIAKQIDIFTKVYQELNANYVDELDPGALMKIGIDAMMETLDPYTVYYSENQIERYKFRAQGKYDGLGARLDKVDGAYTIIEPYEGYAADIAGLKAGDRIIGVNGTKLDGLEEVEVQSMLRGAAGTDVTLEVAPLSGGGSRTTTLTRMEVDRKNVPYAGMVDEEVGYIVLTTFTRAAAANITKELNRLKADNPSMKYVVLDLRNNGGGLLAEAVKICNIFVEAGVEVVTTKGKVRERDRSLKTKNPAVDADIPLVVLINERSASASEIVSGVMQDLDRGVIMGQRSYGKGLVQNRKSLGYNSNMKLTTAKYYIPSGRCIQSVAYKDGEPVSIPDSLRGVFYTKAGRKVLDGGGVSPDVKLPAPQQPEVLTALEKQHIIFKYVNEQMAKMDSITEPAGYRFDGYGDFMKYTREEDFAFALDIEKEVNKLQSLAAEQDDQLLSKIDDLMDEIEELKVDDLTEFKAVIEQAIAQEMVARYHYEEGKIQQRLDADPELDAAITLLKDEKRYQRILTK